MSQEIEELENKLKQYREIAEGIKTLEAKRKELGQEILQMMPEGMKQLQTPGYKVFKQQRLFFKTTLEEAEKFSAVKTDVVVDKVKLKELYEMGNEIPGVSRTEYVMVKELHG